MHFKVLMVFDCVFFPVTMQQNLVELKKKASTIQQMLPWTVFISEILFRRSRYPKMIFRQKNPQIWSVSNSLEHWDASTTKKKHSQYGCWWWIFSRKISNVIINSDLTYGLNSVNHQSCKTYEFTFKYVFGWCCCCKSDHKQRRFRISYGFALRYSILNWNRQKF